MKTLTLILSIFTLFIGCAKVEEIQTENSIYGTWRLVETYNSSGAGDGKWLKVTNSYTYTFNTDGSFKSSRFPECLSGDYDLTSTQITLKYGCVNFDSGITSPPTTFVENFSFEGSFLFLKPSYLNCDEGCSFKFQKIE
jgi:hypothetical protein